MASEAPAVHEEIAKILASETFRTAPVCRQVLEHLLHETEAGEHVSMHTLAEKLYGNVNDVDRARRAVVELRRRLARYYAEEGTRAPWRVVIPNKAYRVELVPAGQNHDILDDSVSLPREALRAPTRRLGMRAWIGVLVLVAIASLTTFLLRRPAHPATYPPPPPKSLVHVQFLGRAIVARGADGLILWSYDLGRTVPPGYVTHPDDLLAHDDTDGDGRDEVAAIVPFDGKCRNDLYLLDDDGKLVRHLELGGKIELGGILQPDCYNGIFVRSLRGRDGFPGDGRWLVTAGHDSGDPCLVATLDARGNELRRFWNVGHLSTFSRWDADGDGREEILLGGANNDFDEAAFLAFDPARISGVSPGTPGIRALPDGNPADGFLRYVRLPMDRRFGGGTRDYVAAFTPMEDGLGVNVSVASRATGESLGLYYYFDREMRCRLTAGDNFREAMQAGGLRTEAEQYAYLDTLAGRVQVWDSGRFRPAGRMR